MQFTEENLKNINAKIRNYELQYHRSKNSVALMAVSKKKSFALIEQAYQGGQRIFGESYVQEALLKQQQLTHLNDIEWHFIGPIQSNKTADLALNFNWIHSVDRMKIAQRLNKQRSDDLPPINICLQVNIDNETTKSGFSEDELIPAVENVLQLKQLKLRGLMAIPKPSDSVEQQRLAFNRVQKLFLQMQTLSDEVDTLSMGMSNDIQAAIAEGSTIVRVGTAIFGSRT